MDKERLEEIKEDYELRHLRGYEWISIPKRNFNWLLSTVEEQQKEINKLNTLDRLHKLAEENARLREALEEIFELSKYDGESRYLDKCYVIARQALEESK